MKILKIVSAIALSTILFFGCEVEKENPSNNLSSVNQKQSSNAVKSGEYPKDLDIDITDSLEFHNAVSNLLPGEILVALDSVVSILDEPPGHIVPYPPLPPDNPNLEILCQLSDPVCEGAAYYIHYQNFLNGICSYIIVDPDMGFAYVMHAEGECG